MNTTMTPPSAPLTLASFDPIAANEMAMRVAHVSMIHIPKGDAIRLSAMCGDKQKPGWILDYYEGQHDTITHASFLLQTGALGTADPFSQYFSKAFSMVVSTLRELEYPYMRLSWDPGPVPNWPRHTYTDCQNQHGAHCPECGTSDALSINTQTVHRLTPHGTEEVGDILWTEESTVQCATCPWHGVVSQLVINPNETDRP
jgi:hypothetical protein